MFISLTLKKRRRESNEIVTIAFDEITHTPLVEVGHSTSSGRLKKLVRYQEQKINSSL